MQPETILLIEDDHGDRELTRRALRSCNSKATLHCVDNGEEALDYLQHKGKFQEANSSPRPDIILLDINMPKLDGRGFLRQLRRIESLSSLPVVTLTTSNNHTDINEMYSLGTNSFITKPSSIAQFVEVIKSLDEYWFQTVALPSPC